jgi:hypothetical protein
MAYIGNNPDAIQTTIEITRFNGTGACTEFQIPQDVDDAKAIEVLVNSVQQDPDNSYTVTNGLITFGEAPSVGTNNVTVLRRTGLTYTRTQIDASDILPNAVTTAAIADGSITSAKIADGTVIAADIADGSVTSSKLSSTLSISGNFLANNVTANTNFITAAGSVGAPAIFPSGDTDTGIFFPAADTIAFTEGGAEAMRIDSSGNVGIGTSSPSTRLNIADIGSGVALQFNGYTGGQNIQAKIECERPNFNNFESQLRFYTHNGSSLAEKMRITESGRVGIGVSSPAQTLDVSGSVRLTFAGGNNYVEFESATNYVGRNSSGNLYLGVTGGNGFGFYVGATERMKIDASGIVTMSAYGAGTATFDASGVISSVSDETWKTKDGVPVNPDEMLQKLEPGYWFYNEEKAPIFGTDRQLGFYAQNVNEAIGNEAAPTPEEGKPWGYYDRSVLAVAVMSLKNALSTIEELKQRIKTLENK